MDIIETFCEFDDHCQNAENNYRKQFPEAETLPPWPSKLALSEVMAIIVFYHQVTGYRNFKSYYTLHVPRFLGHLFPNRVSYSRFIELMPLALIPLMDFLSTRQGTVTGLSFIDSTKIVICHNKRIKSNKVFKGLARMGKSSMGWFYGFKLHLVINEQGQILAGQLTPGNVDDRTPVPEMTKNLTGKLMGDKSYISKALTQKLLEGGLQLITPIKKNMHNKLMPLLDKIILRKRALIETVNDLFSRIVLP
jgi:hypothetical protein